MPRPPSPRVQLATRESGSITIWILGLAVALLFMGGLSLDLWHAFAERLALANAADAASIAGASGIDLDAFRRDATVVIDPQEATARAEQSIAAQVDTSLLTGSQVDVRLPADGGGPTGSITVTLQSRVNFTLLKVLTFGRDAFAVNVTATASPRASA
jgi:Flp pilus assembly protein TadG